MRPAPAIRPVLLALLAALVLGAPAQAMVPPVANDDSQTYDEDDCVLAAPFDCPINVLQNDTDANGQQVSSDSKDENGDPLIITEITPLAAQSSVIAVRRPGNQDIGFQAPRDYCNTGPGKTPDTFTYKISGGDSATLSVTITCVDDPPVAMGDYFTLDEDSDAAPYDVLANDTDVDGPKPQIASITQPDQGGSASVAQGKISYRPKANFCGVEHVTYTLAGGVGSSGSATASFETFCNDPDDPVATDDSFTIGFNAGTTIFSVLANDYDPDDYGDPSGWDAIEIIDITQPVHGTAALVDGGTVAKRADQIAYTPNPGFCGTDSFLYRVFRERVPQARVTVTVPCPAPPIVGGGSAVGGGFTGGGGSTPAPVASARAGTPKVAGTAVQVPLSCTTAASCDVSLGLTTTPAGASAAARKKAVVIGKAKATLRPGQKRTATVKLNAAGKRALKKSRRLRAKLTVTLNGKTLSKRTVMFKRKR